MPCYEERSCCSSASYYDEYEQELNRSTELNIQLNSIMQHYNSQSDYNAKLIGMLCALISELLLSTQTEQDFLDFIKSAETNGSIQGILEWFSQHQQADIKRLVDGGGLPDNASLHEQILWNTIQNELQSR